MVKHWLLFYKFYFKHYCLLNFLKLFTLLFIIILVVMFAIKSMSIYNDQVNYDEIIIQ